jgi:hypothetical protein
VTVDEWPVLNAIYEEYATGRNCVIARPEYWWRQRVFEWAHAGTTDVAVWENRDGQARGYVVYQTRSGMPPDRPWPQSRLWLRELVTQDAEAYVALVNLLSDMHTTRCRCPSTTRCSTGNDQVGSRRGVTDATSGGHRGGAACAGIPSTRKSVGSRLRCDSVLP